MIALKDIPILVGLAGTVFGGGAAWHGLKVDIAEVSRDYRQHVTTQQKKELIGERIQLEKLLKVVPDDEKVKADLELNRQLMEENKQMEEQLRKEKSK